MIPSKDITLVSRCVATFTKLNGMNMSPPPTRRCFGGTANAVVVFEAVKHCSKIITHKNKIKSMKDIQRESSFIPD
jgi:hypothetical protein